MSNVRLLVTVGTTRFDALVAAVLAPRFLAAALSAHVIHISVQHGASPAVVDVPALAGLGVSCVATSLVEENTALSGGHRSVRYFLSMRRPSQPETAPSAELELVLFPLAPSLEPLMDTCDLVLSHAGTGSILESFARNKPLVVVPNNALMHNHQRDLALELHRERVLICCEDPDALADVVFTPLENEPLRDLNISKNKIGARLGIDPGKWWKGRDPADGPKRVLGVVLQEAFLS
ncbi:N-acetylglucosaminyldiphosphodolichol N-acetylglucosaminyltransferase catalytic subunit alg13 [Entophlyctis sp. JEL0112]|nr:N-acetylglucosaminyldiphosphodolichol N-acetylglucosaminyltransferase catalytic subunit alg13 [Entophlyctis sp. JEL0112]